MNRANRVIVWGSLLTVFLVAACLRFPFFALNPAEGDIAGEVIAAVSLFAGYLILVLGILAVGSSTYANLTLRRADTTLETWKHRQYFNLGVTFCVIALGFIFFTVVF